MQQDFPPLSDSEIKALIAEYLDGPSPDAEKTAYLQQVLASHPEYMEEFTRQQALKASVSHLTNQAQAPVESGSLWGAIAEQLNADRRAEVKTYDYEFISAYYDGEIASSEQELAAFEAQLFHNPDANRMLADIGELSEMVRQFGYRLEESCTVDVTASVMARYRAELAGQSGATDEAGELDPELELKMDPLYEALSGLYDQELSAKETIELNARIESDDACRRILAEFNDLSEHIQRVSLQIQAQAPDLLPVISPQLPGIIAENAKKPARILPFGKRIAIPVAAAAVLLLVFNVGNFQSAPRKSVGLLAEQSAAYEVAAVPGALMGGAGGDGNVHPAAYQSRAMSPAMADSAGPEERQVAASVTQNYAKAHQEEAATAIPSSEAFLFEALEKSVSSEDEIPLVLSDDTTF